MGFPGGSVVKNLPANAGDTGSVPELGRSTGERKGNPLQNSCLGNPLDRGAWCSWDHKTVEHSLATEQQIEVQLIYSVVFLLSNRVSQLYVHIHPLFLDAIPMKVIT